MVDGDGDGPWGLGGDGSGGMVSWLGAYTGGGGWGFMNGDGGGYGRGGKSSVVLSALESPAPPQMADSA